MRGNEDQPGLELWPREHDLPPRWDGLPVEWGAWIDSAPIIMCPPPKRPSRCGRCRSERPVLVCTGRLFSDPATAPPAIGQARLSRDRHLVGVMAAFRCTDCQHDTVRDPDGQYWDLDDTDYRDAGSFDVNASTP